MLYSTEAAAALVLQLLTDVAEPVDSAADVT